MGIMFKSHGHRATVVHSGRFVTAVQALRA